MTHSSDCVSLAQRLVRFRSVTPSDDGLYDWLVVYLEGLGFSCYRHCFGSGSERVDNLYARWSGSSDKDKHFAFAGHTDVVPAGDESLWRFGAFSGHIDRGILFGRGVVDMKGSIACFLAAVASFIDSYGASVSGSLGLFLTNDEEGVARYGMKPLMQWAAQQDVIPQLCLLGEPTAQQRVGDSYRSGRRGSLHFRMTCIGESGHTAYPRPTYDPMLFLLRVVEKTQDKAFWGEQKERPDVVVTSVSGDAEAENISLSTVALRLHVRFASVWQSHEIESKMRGLCDAVAEDCRYDLQMELRSEAFVSCRDDVIRWVQDVVEACLGWRPQAATGGGSSDARFIRAYCPVIELGLKGRTMHQRDECCAVDDLHVLTRVYTALLQDFFIKP